VVLAGGSYIYFRDSTRRETGVVADQFTRAKKFAEIPRQRHGDRIASYELWWMEQPKAPIQGRTP
jgi:hypothetical protein